MTDTTTRRRVLLYSVATLASLYLMGMIAWTQTDRLAEGRNDFVALYAGPHLLSTGSLYDNQQLTLRGEELTGFYSQAHGYIRPPFVAALMWPLSRLPYQTALRVWQIASLAALLGFVLLWDPAKPSLTILVTAMSAPSLFVLLQGQDVHFLMLAIAVSARLRLSGKSVASGAVFALCAAKPHLFLLTPIWILARRDWGFLKGLLYGGGALAFLSTVVADWRWPLEMWREIGNPVFTPSPEKMPNLHGALYGLPHAELAELAFATAAAWAVWTIARRSSFLPAFAAALLGGVLLARHSYLQDLSLLIPAALVVLRSSELLTVKAGALALLAPPLLFLVIQGPPYSNAVAAICWVVLICWAIEFLVRTPSPPNQEVEKAAA